MLWLAYSRGFSIAIFFLSVGGVLSYLVAGNIVKTV